MVKVVLLRLEAVATCICTVCRATCRRSKKGISLPTRLMLTLYSSPMCTLSHLRLL